MLIEIDEKSGFCFGVVRAIDTAERLLAERGGGYSLGDVVHNRVEVDRLERLGLHTITHAQICTAADRPLLIRAHGEPPETYALANSLGVELVDATCPVVARLQRLVRSAWEEMRPLNGQVVIFGKRGHAEVIGLSGQTGNRALVVEGPDDLAAIDFSRPIYLLSQTTQPLDLFEQVRSEILRRAADPAAVQVRDTICRQVSNRNPHLREFAARYQVILFVSGRKSSNGKALYEVCASVNPRTHWVEEPDELRPEWFADCQSVGICGATSTPKWLMEQVAAAVPPAMP